MMHRVPRCHSWLLVAILGGVLTAQAAYAHVTRPQTVSQSAQATLKIWTPSGSFATSSLVKVPRFWRNAPPAAAPDTLPIASVRNTKTSAQLAVMAATPIKNLRATVSALVSTDGTAIPATATEIRYVGYVPVVPHDPRAGGATIAEVAGRAVSGAKTHLVVADPLWPMPPKILPADVAQPIWLTFHIPATAAPGIYRGHIQISADDVAPVNFPLQLTVTDPVLPDPGKGHFHLNVWFNPNALAAAYHVKPWSSRHWQWIQRYFRFLAHAGQRTILTTIVPQPWRVAWNNWKPQTAVGYDSMVKWSFDGSHWTFNYARFDRYVEAAIAAGLGPKIVAYSLLSFRGPQRLTYKDPRTGTLHARTLKAGTPLWNQAWCAFTANFSTHLRARGWLDHTWLGFDERPPALIRSAMDLLQRCAPAFLHRTEMAGTQDISHSAQDLSLGLASLRQVSNAWIDARRKQGKITTFYTWAGDTHPNTLSFSPAVEAQMMGWIIAKRHLDGYLHWAFNNWPHDVFHHPVYAFSQGDEYLVYPGKNGPVSSIRWELLQQGLADAELVAMARKKHANSEVLQAALQLATRNPDGRKKDVQDIIKARAMVVSLLRGSN